ncbi:hypothetical protein IV498_00535 [Paenarthrobacter sp. Z7-10]|uniref:hypothetical protein n=1 Tax=Paenarthrobacter sp. Z7-10 TaxID=2787635 RepID=UPI0022A9F53E|nr:hypothetical protein [Paenarthrobacter sp. Z7-10]MCZ2401708.1 hypothetical protein [Paenarthrobacter sp. Z7-10]
MGAPHSAPPQLTKVSAAESGELLRVEFDLDKSLPTHGTYLLGLVAASADYSHQRRLSIEFVNGDLVDFSTFNHDQVDQEHHDHSGVTFDGATIVAQFPTSSIGGLGRGRLVTAYSHVDGERLQSRVPVDTSGF